MGLANSKRESL